MNQAEKVHVFLQRQEQSDHFGRFSTSQEIVIYCFGFKLHTTEAQNIGLDGLRVRSDLSKLPVHAYIEVGFRLRNEVGSELFRIPVFRDQAGEAGTDLLFVFPAEHEDQLEGSLASHFKFHENAEFGSQLSAS
ncbi:MAG TPA: hypothetical protein DD827_06480 [Gammaproteobacteria bacterium]|nr:hypothetical protein [Gammaproteobacteria bacterium]